MPQSAKFDFDLVGDSGAPMPTSTTGSVTINPGDTSGTVTFGSVTYTAAGTYTYHVTEKSTDAAGWTYDSSKYDIVVTVTDNAAKLTAVGKVTKSGNAAAAVEFTNSYAPASVTLDSPSVTKVISGTKPGSDETFSFKLVGQDGAPMPADSTGDTFITTRDGAGTVDMGQITYTTAGTYTYKLSEVAGTNKNYAYDSTVYDVTVVVTDDAGALKADRTIEKDGAKVETAQFDNKFTSGDSIETNKVTDVTEATPGQNITYTITVKNTGDTKAVGVWVKDVIPAGTTFVSCDGAGVVSDDQTYVNWFVPELSNEDGSELTYTMTVRVNDDVADGTKISNTAKVEVTASPDKPDFTAEPQNDTPTATTKVVQKTDPNPPSPTPDPTPTPTPDPTPAPTPSNGDNGNAANSSTPKTGDGMMLVDVAVNLLLIGGFVALVARRRMNS